MRPATAVKKRKRRDGERERELFKCSIEESLGDIACHFDTGRLPLRLAPLVFHQVQRVAQVESRNLAKILESSKRGVVVYIFAVDIGVRVNIRSFSTRVY